MRQRCPPLQRREIERRLKKRTEGKYCSRLLSSRLRTQWRLDHAKNRIWQIRREETQITAKRLRPILKIGQIQSQLCMAIIFLLSSTALYFKFINNKNEQQMHPTLLRLMCYILFTGAVISKL